MKMKSKEDSWKTKCHKQRQAEAKYNAKKEKEAAKYMKDNS